MKRDLQVIEIGYGFAVRRQGELRLLSIHESRTEAEHAALRLAWDDGVEVVSATTSGRTIRLRPSAPVQAVLPPRQAARRGGARRAASKA